MSHADVIVPADPWLGRWKVIGPENDPLMLRLVLLRTPWGHLYVHKFLRSDVDRDLHDHPWSFLTIPIWRGYTEEIPTEEIRKTQRSFEEIRDPGIFVIQKTERVFRRPFIPLWRPATWTHRVEVERGRPAWSLIWVCRKHGTKERNWGFYDRERNSWVPWKVYVEQRAAEGVAV